MSLDICSWEERNWEALLWAIYRQRCILLLGPDAALEATGSAEPQGEAGEELRPSCEILANQLAEELAQDNQEDLEKWHINRNDLPQVAQYYVLVHNRCSWNQRSWHFMRPENPRPARCTAIWPNCPFIW